MRLGILGGSFNPVHSAHLRLGIEAMEQLGLDRVDLIPAADPYHKKDGEMLPYEDRFRLTEMAVADVYGLEASDLEAGLDGPSYTCDLLKLCAGKNPGHELYFILGSENVLRLPDWKDGLRIPDMAHLAVMCRGGVSEADVGEFLARRRPDACKQAQGPVWTFSSGKTLSCLSMGRMDISSTDIRTRWREGRSLACLVPREVKRTLALPWPALEKAWRARS